jgi:catechol 2,3-dioxygenase-like lactoylglutathione lyase family enzyme
MPDPMTFGVHHVGLSVLDVASAWHFFCGAPDWKLLGKNEKYPAAYVCEGSTTLTLLQVNDPATATPFDRRANVGLHPLAAVADEAALEAAFEHVSRYPGVTFEFALGPAYAGPRNHVAEAVGCQSEAAFQRAFKQRIGMTPASRRKAGREMAGHE